MRGWLEFWHQFLALLAQQPVPVVLAVWVGLALVIVMALEGFTVNLVPAQAFRRYLEKVPERNAAIVEGPMPTPKLVSAAIAPAMPASAGPGAPAKTNAPKARKNAKKPAPGPKRARATTGWRRVPFPRVRLSRGTLRLLVPKN